MDENNINNETNQISEIDSSAVDTSAPSQDAATQPQPTSIVETAATRPGTSESEESQLKTFGKAKNVSKQLLVKPILTPEEIEANIIKDIQSIQIYKRHGGLRDLPSDAYQLSQVLGFQSHKRSNIHFIEDNVILSSVGNVMFFQNLKSGESRHIQGPREGSIGCIAVHPSKTLIAVGELCDVKPNIYLYQYPSMKVVKILKGAAVRGYTDLCFNQTGTRIASLASEPDYMLTIWDWEESLILLRSKAFSQDVFKVSFSPDNDGILTTSGMGHIKFWRMSSTFTGLKLQGSLGKFGATELTDISAFVQLPDGKVLSSTETGNLLLWDGGMIKCEIGLKGKKPCHQGKIDTVLLGEGEIITAGEDGLVKIWDLETIDNADVVSANGAEGSSASVPRVFEMEPIDEILIAKDVKIKCLIRNPSNSLEFMVQDQQGQLIKLDLNKRSTEKILSFHSGSVSGVSCSPSLHTMATLGIDGNLRVYNYLSKEVILKNHYAQGGTFLTYLPLSSDSTGSTVLAGFNDGVIRFVSIVSNKTLVLQYVIKPSKSAITFCSFSPDGTKLAVGSSDKSVFLFHLQIKKDGKGSIQPFSKAAVQIVPLGYFLSVASITSLSFAPEDESFVPAPGKRPINCKRLLICSANGTFSAALIPNDADFDTSATFELNPEAIQLKTWSLSIPEKEVLISQNAVEQAPPEEGEIPSTTTRSRSHLLSQSMLSYSLSTLRKQITSTSAIHCSLALSHGYFVAGVENQSNEVEIRLFKFSRPEFSLLLGIVVDLVTVLSYDLPKKHLLVGTKHGSCTIFKFNYQALPFDARDADSCPDNHESYSEYVKRFENRIQNTLKALQKENPTLDITNPSPYTEVDGQQWNANLHDVVNGKVTAFCSSFDGSHFISTGTDGGIFVWKSSAAKIQDEVTVNADLTEQLNPSGQPEDIVDGTAYSIQEEKLKSEEDRELVAAETKKSRLRSQIEDLRKDFTSIVAEIEGSSKSVRLDRSELIVDPYLKRDIELEAEKKKEYLLKELAWQAEKDAIGPAKLIKKYLQPLHHERIEIVAFKSQSSVATFRTLKIDQQVESAFQLQLGEYTPDRKIDPQNESGKATTNKDTNANASNSHASKKSTPKQVQTSVKKLEARKQFRAERAATWKHLMDSKPDDKYQDPADVTAIRYAIAHMGDYKLKSADNYIVPESERVDADKKKRQILLLNESIKSLKEQFNDKVFRLRTRKVNLVDQFKTSNKKIRGINVELSALKEKVDMDNEYQPTLEPDIFPENRTVVTEEDIQNLEQEDLQASFSQNRKGGDDMGFGTGVAAAPTKPKELSKPPKLAEAVENSSNLFISGKALELEPTLEERVHKTKLIYEKNTILKNLQQQVKDFDYTLDQLFNERILLSSDLKFADIKLQLLFREWMLLKEFEQTDNVLAEKLNARKVEKHDIETKIDEYRDKLGAKRLEIETVIGKEKEIHDEFRKIIGENNKGDEYLTKVFKRKIKRVKKKVKAEGESLEDEEVDEEEEDDDMSSYNSDEDEGLEFEEARPHDCDHQVWDKILEIRERRLDLEENLIEVQKAVELLKKENDSLIKKEKIIDLAMKNAESEIEDFQTQKQRKLNELDVVVPLRFSQLQYLVNDQVPYDLSSSLVFYNDGLSQLKRRIKELHQEKNDIKKQHRELKKLHVSFNKSKKEKEQRVSELTAKNRDVQMLKFGQIVDLEKLEKLGANRVADEVKEKLEKEDIQRIREIAEMDGKIREEKEKLMTVVKVNTECLESIVDLQKQRDSLEKTLNQSQSVLTTELSGPNQKETDEKEKLITLVQSQAAQIDAIKVEIENLIRKPTSRAFLKIPPKIPLKTSIKFEKTPLPPLAASRDTITENTRESILEEEEDSVALDVTSAAAE